MNEMHFTQAFLPEETWACRSILIHAIPPIAQTASNGIKLWSPRSPASSPRLNAPYLLLEPASAKVSIDPWFNDIRPDQNAGHAE